ncbi:MAG: DUF4870 domain-containing protein [Leptospiraceae bacterium]|nr:DUF4870 domain-containing protein [Leptospiraceae bacterium]
MNTLLLTAKNKLKRFENAGFIDPAISNYSTLHQNSGKFMPEVSYAPLPAPEEVPKKEREDAMGSYLMMFAAWAIGLPLPLINLLAAFIYYMINRKSSRFVKFHSLQSMLSQVFVSILNASVIFWTFRNVFAESGFNKAYFGFLAMVFIFNLIYTVLSIIAAVKANKGEMYYFVFFGKLSYHWAYQEKDESSSASINKPPF